MYHAIIAANYRYLRKNIDHRHLISKVAYFASQIYNETITACHRC